MFQNYWKFQNRNVQTFGFVYHDTDGQNHGPVGKTQSFLSSGICMVTFLQDCYGKGNLRKSYWSTVGKKFPNWECLFVQREKGLFLSVYVIKFAGKKQNINPMWKVLNKEVDFGEPTSFLDHVYLGWTQRQCETSKDIVDNYRTMLESRNSTERNWNASILWEFSYFFMVLWYGRSCQEMCGTILWAGKQDDSNNTTKYQLHALMTIISKKKNWNPWENCQKYALKMFLKCLYLAQLEDLIFYGQ